LWAQSLFFLVPFLIVREIRFNTLRANRFGLLLLIEQAGKFSAREFSDVSFRSETVPSLHT
jgi:hypothetical protein